MEVVAGSHVRAAVASRPVSALLIIGDTVRNPELRHEVPLGIPDGFVYAEIDGRRIVVISAMEAMRVEGLGTGLEVRPTEDFGADEIRRSGLDVHAAARELTARVSSMRLRTLSKVDKRASRRSRSVSGRDE